MFFLKCFRKKLGDLTIEKIYIFFSLLHCQTFIHCIFWCIPVLYICSYVLFNFALCLRLFPCCLRARACELCTVGAGGSGRASLRAPLLHPSPAFRLFRLEKRKKRKREDRRSSSRNRRKKKERGRERRRSRRKEKRGSQNGKRPPRSPEQGEVTHTDLQTGTSARGPQCRQGRLSCEREAVTRKASGRCVWRGRRECPVGGRVTSSRPGGDRPRPPQPRGGRGACRVRGSPPARICTP